MQTCLAFSYAAGPCSRKQANPTTEAVCLQAHKRCAPTHLKLLQEAPRMARIGAVCGLLTFLAGCAVDFSGEREAALRAEIAAEKSAVLKLQKDNASLAALKHSTEQERNAFKEQLDQFFAQKVDDLRAYSLDEGALAVAKEISVVLIKEGIRQVSVGPITLDGRPRNSEENSRAWLAFSSKPIHENFDQLGIQIEELLKQQLTEHRVIEVSDKAPIVVRGAYRSGTPNTFKLLLRITARSKPNEFKNSFTVNISEAGLSKRTVHIIDQLEDVCAGGEGYR